MLLFNPNLIVISGGPGSGKTTLLRELKCRGCHCSEEVARRVIQDQVRSGGDAVPWGNREAYTRLMLEGSIAAYLEDAKSPNLVYFDRGIPDTLTYARLIALPEDSLLRQACERYRYRSPVYLCPPWEEIYEKDSERKQTFAEAVNTYELLKAVYRECGYEVIDVPKVSPAKRAEFLLRPTPVS